MIHSEFHQLFKPQVLDTSKKKADKLTKLSKSKNARKHYSMSRDMRGMASGILREMLHRQNGSAMDAISMLMSNQTQRSDAKPYIELNSNGSQFCVFASIRQCVLDHQLKSAAIAFNSTFAPIFANELRDSEEEDADTKPKEPVLKVPKVVALGICMAFDLIRESRSIHQQLCVKALKALLNTLQGLSPEALKNEPSDVINPLFELLSELASSPTHRADNCEPSTSTSSAIGSDNCQSQLRCYACSALLSLVVARGDTGKILSAVTALLTSPQLTSDNSDIETPNILITLQRSVHSVLLGKKKRPDWVTHGFPITSFCDSFRVHIFSEAYSHSHQSSLAFDGKYLFLYSGNVIYKIGSGYCGTVKGQLINSCSIGSHKSQSGQIGWIGSVGDFLYLQTNNWTRNELIKLDKDLMKEVGKVAVGVTNWGPTACASDNDSLILITSTKDDCFVIRTLKPNLHTSSLHTINASNASNATNASNSSNSTNQMSVIQELTIKLSHKCLSVCGGIGSTIFDKSLSPNEQMKQNMLRTIDNIEADDIMQICSGKDFAVIRTQTGKILFTGKAQSLGIKQNGSTIGKWCELPITKSPKIEHIAVGHEGAHALLVSEDGSVFFVGLAKRGEDGEQAKGRRQPKAGKPKKMVRMEGKRVDFVACNHGSSAIVTKTGELYIFGKDAHHVDRNTGLVVSLKNIVISQVAIGKAHILALSNKGHVYTFGISNKGQCGLDLLQATSAKDLSHNQEEMEDGNIEHQIDMTEDVIEPLCSLGHHRWKYDQCMICTICGECTGYGSSCIASGKSERNPGMSCGCGAGDAGCTDCGCCRACETIPKEPTNVEENDGSMLPLNRMAYNVASQLNLCEPNVAEMQRFATAFSLADVGMIPSSTAANDLRNNELNYEELPIRCPNKGDPSINRLNPRIERRRIGLDVLGRRLRHASKAYRNLVGAAAGKANMVDAGGDHSAQHFELIDKAVSNVINIDIDQGSDGETSKLTPLPPTRLNISSRITQMACGLHHSVLLTSTGDVLTFGSNTHGQLGHSDFAIREVPIKVLINATVVQIAAGSNHTVLLTSYGQVYTFGSNQKGQLARSPSAIDYAWNAIPGIIPNIGQQFGRKATWISACGDHTFVKLDESLINPLSLSSARVIANRRCIAIIAPNIEMSTNGGDFRNDSNDRKFHSLVISRVDGSCKSFNTSDQLELSKFSAICLDSNYDVLWTYNSETRSINRYNIIASEAKIPNQSLSSILLPELALPQKSSTKIKRTTVALNLLCTLETLTSAHQLGWTIQDDEQSKNQIIKSYSKDDFSMVCRFESHGGGWGFSSHSIEAIRFMADTDILLGGFGLFGGRGEYTAKLKLFDIGVDGGEQEGDGEILTETEEMPYECASRQKYPILFDEPISLQANRWYVAWARISGPSSDCGSSGQSVVTTEDQVIFYFKSSKKSNNGTDVNAGQIPQLLYKVYSGINDISNYVSCRSDYNSIADETICIIGREFSLTVTYDCFQSLLKLLRWSWQTFKAIMFDINSFSSDNGSAIHSMILELKHLKLICCASLHLLKIYINEIFPNKHEQRIQTTTNDSLILAECIYDVRTLFKIILSDPPEWAPRNQSYSDDVNDLIRQIMCECHESFLSCYHAFYPTSCLRWRGLCDLLLRDDQNNASHSVYLLSAMLASLCRPWVRLTQTFPMMHGLDVYNLQSPSDIQSPNSDIGNYQNSILNEKMLEKSDKEGCHSGSECSFRDIINKLLKIIGQPIEFYLQQENSENSAECSLSRNCAETGPTLELVENACDLISTILSELVAQITGIGFDPQILSGQQLHITPSRFSRISQNRTWNTGNGSPDAICFSVDKPGISIAGVTVYGGIGNEWHYELELLDYYGIQSDERAVPRDAGQSWRTLDMIRGSYTFEDKAVDVCEIKFERAIPISPNVKYAIRLKNHGPRTNNGDGGLTHIRGLDNTTFTFSDCSLSFNGTNHARGQIPQILYYSAPQSFNSESIHYPINEEIPRKNSLAISDSVISLAINLLIQTQEYVSPQVIMKISSSHLIKKLLPLTLAYLSPIATSDCKSSIQILSMIRQLLPLVVYLNKSNDFSVSNRSLSPLPSCLSAITTSRHYVTVESDHPYKPAFVYNYKVKFPQSVKWMCVEFDSRCATAQPEDSLQLFVPSGNSTVSWDANKNSKNNDQTNTLWPILRKFKGRCNCWPTNSIVIPSNELIFSLETASDYVKEEKASYYGFKCQVIGYENPLFDGYLGLQYLEQELTYLSGICIGTLLKKNINLPQIGGETDDNLELALRTFELHSTLLSKGLSLSHPLIAHDALDGILPLANEHPFLKDFCALTPGTSGARLAKWFQCESFVDPSQCEVLCSCVADQELQCGWPTVITIITRDQYGNMVNVPNLKVEVSAQPFHSNANTQLKQSKTDVSLGGVTVPPSAQNVHYSITSKDKMFYHAITMMKQYENYSFEELRYVSPIKRRTMETMLVRSNNDGTYTANWTPGSTGWYQLKITVDGVTVNSSQSVQVGEPTKSVPLPLVQAVTAKSSKKAFPSRTRKFVGRNSAGLRIRSLPSLQSEQIGVLEINGIITIIEELHNDDGVWVRLAHQSIKKYCNTNSSQQQLEAWCLQYNQHLGKTLLVPIGESKPIVISNGPTTSVNSDKKFPDFRSVRRKKYSQINKPLELPAFFHVVKCGVSGHNIRSKPHLRAPPVGMVVLGNVVAVVADLTNSSGTWVKLDEESMKRYCFNTDGEGWSLSRTINDVIYLQHEAEVMHITDEEDDDSKYHNSNYKSFSRHNGLPSIPFGAADAKSTNVNTNLYCSSNVFDKSFSSNKELMSLNSVSQSVASESEVESIPNDSFISGMSPSLVVNTFAEFEKTDIDTSAYCDTSVNDSISSATTAGSRVAALQKKFLYESDAKAYHKNANKSLSESPSREPPPELVGINVKELVKAIRDQSPTPPNTPPLKRTPVTSRSSSPNVSVGSSKRSQQQTSASIAIKSSAHSSPISELNSNNVRTSLFENTVTLDKSSNSNKAEAQRKSFIQKATQTSPPEDISAMHSYYSQFKLGNDVKLRSPQSSPSASPKPSRTAKDISRASRQSRSKRDKTSSPSSNFVPFQVNASNNRTSSAIPVKEAISNSVAECIRSVFAAFIWHEGILHDTLAAASYLKFNPEVTKETVKSLENDYNYDRVKLRPYKKADCKGPTKEEKAKFRHSVEVSQLSALQQECYLNANIDQNKISESEVSQQEFACINEGNNDLPMSQSEETANDNVMIPETLVNLLKLWQVVSMCVSNSITEPPISVITPANLTPPSTPVQMFNKIQNNPKLNQQNCDDIYNEQTQTKTKQLNDVSNTNVAKASLLSANRFVNQLAQSHQSHGNLFGEAALANNSGHYESRESAHSSLCELCGNSYPYPVTHHMRKTHPGCGEHAGGKGYNSSGSFCGGWAGHCGDGGIGSSNWYLICDKCRDKYLTQKRYNNKGANVKSKHSTAAEQKSLPLNSPVKTNISSPITPMEVHQVIKENALFLLRMSPANDVSGISSAWNSVKTKQTQEFIVQSSSFQCLENLGIHHSTYHQRLAEEHLSEDDIRAIQNGRPSKISSVDENSANDFPKKSLKPEESQKTLSSRSSFHRSVSVGLTDWQQERVILTQRKRATSNDNSSTTFLCQPSATLINLVHACCVDTQINLQAKSVQNLDNTNNALVALLNRPIMQFILQQHHLNALLIAMKNALRKCSCRTLALNALNWLLRNVSQTVSLHDLMWCFVASLTPNELRQSGEKDESEENAVNGVISANAANIASNVSVNSFDRRDDNDVHYYSQTGICQHPLVDLSIAGEAAQFLTNAFHAFLQTVSDLMPLLPMGSPLQQIAVRCFCINFDPTDHSFLHQCHVFSNISKIFSRTEEENSYSEEMHQSVIHPIIESYQDITSLMEIKASSRQAMIASLTDNSTETFWESGDEDRNKTKTITINNNAGKDVLSKIIYIHIDNVRDLGSKVSQITFKYGDLGVLETQMTKLKVVEVENRFTGWIHCVLPSDEVLLKSFKLEFKGPDNTLRLRQIKLLGLNVCRSQDNIKPVLNSIQIQQANCEAETLRVFRLLTSQVFGKLISGEADLDGVKNEVPVAIEQTIEMGSSGAANDLREHMVGILFSRSGKLTFLQKQVCAHIVQAIRVEAIRLREEWESLLCSKSTSIAIGGEIPSDAYCFEMLSMVLALSGSTAGRQYLALQNDLLLDLFSLLHTSSARVQRQVTSLLRRVLPEIKPSVFASMFGISALPSRDIIVSNEKEEFDVHIVGILDVFLACIAKSLTVQTKVKGLVGSSSKTMTTITLATAIHPRDYLGDRWWLRGCLSRKLAECIISLLKDMASGKLSDSWASVAKNAIAQNILNLTRMSENYRTPSECIKTPTLWIALASLCVLEQEHAERLSSSHWVNVGDQANGNQQSRPLCDNHDDGETPAIILCNNCGNLCAECDRYLHLHSKTRNHQRQVFKEEEEAIKVDLHEGCGRTKLFWVMALADSKTLKAMVEFRGENTRTKIVSAISGQKTLTSNATGICRFCGTTGNIGILAMGNICSEPECQEYAKNACNKLLSCGHPCGGIVNEERCLPCLHGCTGELKQDGDDMCMICFSEALSCAPVIQLKCGHLFHKHCCKAVLTTRWPGPRITFSFSLCPICKNNIEHYSLQELLMPIKNLYDDVHRKALMRLEYEGLHRCEAITVSGARFFNDPAGYAMERYAYYVCCKCKKAYYGGEARCDADAGIGDNYDPSELVCGGCSDVSRAQMCPKHGTDFLEYKCRYCCSVAVFFCFGTTHFCNACHDDFQKLTNLREFPKCPAGPRGKQLEGDECPLHVKHPPTGEEFALGCGVCRNAHTF